MVQTSHSIGGLRYTICDGRSQIIWTDDRTWGQHHPETYLNAFSRHCSERPNHPFLRIDGQTRSFRELDVRSTRMANVLTRDGIVKGQTVVVLFDNCDDMVTTFFAVTRLGAVWVPINTAYRGEFLRHQIADFGASLVICDSMYLNNVLAVSKDAPDLKQIVVSNWDGTTASDLPIKSLEAIRGDDEAPISVPIDAEETACLIYTSGTTGPSKGCMLSHNSLSSMGHRRNISVVPRPGGVTWSCLPLFHINALGTTLIATLLAGEQVAIAARFSVSRFWDEIEASGATSAMLLASMFPLLAQAPDTPAMVRCRGQLDVVTGIPLSPSDRKIWHERFGVRFMNTFAYGQTEAMLVTLLPCGEALPPLDSMGPPSEDFDVMVVGADRRPVPIGEVGELAVRPRSPGIMFSGYWRAPAATLKSMRDLWWHTGDLVRMDGHGYLYFVDRKKDYLRSRGENISSFEVESATMKHPAISEVAFHAVFVAEGAEEAIKATVVLREGHSLTEYDLFAWAREKLPYFAVPRYIEFRRELPKTPTGKIQKDLLRTQGKTHATWDSVAAGLEIHRTKARRSP